MTFPSLDPFFNKILLLLLLFEGKKKVNTSALGVTPWIFTTPLSLAPAAKIPEKHHHRHLGRLHISRSTNRSYSPSSEMKIPSEKKQHPAEGFSVCRLNGPERGKKRLLVFNESRGKKLAAGRLDFLLAELISQPGNTHREKSYSTNAWLQAWRGRLFFLSAQFYAINSVDLHYNGLLRGLMSWPGRLTVFELPFEDDSMEIFLDLFSHNLIFTEIQQTDKKKLTWLIF